MGFNWIFIIIFYFFIFWGFYFGIEMKGMRESDLRTVFWVRE